MAAILPPQEPDLPTRLELDAPFEPLEPMGVESTLILGMEPWAVLVAVVVGTVAIALRLRRSCREVGH